MNAPVILGPCTLYHGDCREIMPTLSGVDAVVTDPPYGILNLAGDGSTVAVRKSPRQQGSGKLKSRILNTSDVRWDIAPDAALFDAMRRISKRQIIWGGNYFPLPPARGILVWDKEQPWENFSQVEIAWTNLERPAALFRMRSGIPGKVHPTQKPIELMAWCIAMLEDDDATVIDPFMGSGTTAISCIRTGRRFIGIEIDASYFKTACDRIERELDQPALPFASEPAPAEQLSILR